ncbi:MAG: hypothetical protein Q7R98_01595 [Candidatus Jorgensenbacteria bacterium]|nr:hypothetical protein [Candidatus Jorgensenbacteria bacterium]
MKFFNKKILFTVFFVSFIVFIIPHQASALGWSTSEIVGGFFYYIGYLFNFISGALLILGGWLVDIALQLNFDILNSTNKVVQIGWTITRDLANLGFVLLAIIIAIATIVRYQSYGNNKLLGKLIAVAILVNFSLTIAGSLIQFSNVLTKFFIRRTVPEGTSLLLSDTIGRVINPQKFLTPPADPPPPDPAEQGGGLATFGTAVLVGLTTLVFNVAFTMIAAITMLGFAFMLLARYLYLSVLLILAPMACLTLAFPALSEHWSKWWKKFTEQLLFAPAMSFFVYLAVVAAQQFAENPPTGIVGGTALGAIRETISNGLNLIVLCGILMMGLITAQSMGATGAKAALGAAQSLGNSTKKWAGNIARRSTQATARTRFGQNVAKRLQGGGKALQGVAGDYWKVKPDDGFMKRWSKRAANVATKATGFSSLSGATGELLSGRAKTMQDLAKAPDIKAKGIIGILTRGGLESIGAIEKKEEKPQERKSKGEITEDIKTRENLKENMIQAGYKEDSKEVMGIDTDVKRLKGELNRIIENEIRVDLGGKGMDEVNANLKKIIDGFTDDNGKKNKGQNELQSEFSAAKADWDRVKDDEKASKTDKATAKKKFKETEGALTDLNFRIKTYASVAVQKDKEQGAMNKAMGVTGRNRRGQSQQPPTASTSPTQSQQQPGQGQSGNTIPPNTV